MDDTLSRGIETYCFGRVIEFEFANLAGFDEDVQVAKQVDEVSGGPVEGDGAARLRIGLGIGISIARNSVEIREDLVECGTTERNGKRYLESRYGQLCLGQRRDLDKSLGKLEATDRIVIVGQRSHFRCEMKQMSRDGDGYREGEGLRL